jgi:hypothetical protein
VCRVASPKSLQGQPEGLLLVRRLTWTCVGQHVIVEADRGEDLGEVTAAGVIAERKCSGSSGGCATPVPEHA